MSYEVLARKWRPANFEALVGQEHVQRALVNALDENRLHHAYLFTGTRGVGKTTIARIFARSLNCETGVTSKPCGECSACREIAEGRFIDLIEVDAASRTKVDETRELLENVQYAPSRGRYKVYLIDEVHMFSGHSFNALLKTLEEPPPHVKFLLATTDPQKLPVTILSRCLQFNLKRLPMSLIIGHLQQILDTENVEYDLAALQLLAEGADGSMRDALSLLDQSLAFGAGAVREAEVREMLGTVSRDKVLNILKALLARDAGATMSALAELAQLTPDYDSVLAELLSMFHHMALAQKIPEALEDYVAERESLIQLCQQVSGEDLQLFYQIALIGRRDLPLAPDLRSGLEMVLLRMLSFRPAGTELGVSTATAVTPASGRQASATTSEVAKPVQKTSARPEAATDLNTATAADPVRAVPVADRSTNDWRSILEQLSISGMVKQLASNCILKSRTDSVIVLELDAGHRQLRNDKAEQRLRKALCEFYDNDLRLEFVLEEKKAGAAATGATATETPAQTEQREQSERQQQAENAIQQDGFVQAMKKNFNAEIVPGSVKPVTDKAR